MIRFRQELMINEMVWNETADTYDKHVQDLCDSRSDTQNKGTSFMNEKRKEHSGCESLPSIYSDISNAACKMVPRTDIFRNHILESRHTSEVQRNACFDASLPFNLSLDHFQIIHIHLQAMRVKAQ